MPPVTNACCKSLACRRAALPSALMSPPCRPQVFNATARFPPMRLLFIEIARIPFRLEASHSHDIWLENTDVIPAEAVVRQIRRIRQAHCRQAHHPEQRRRRIQETANRFRMPPASSYRGKLIGVQHDEESGRYGDRSYVTVFVGRGTVPAHSSRKVILL